MHAGKGRTSGAGLNHLTVVNCASSKVASNCYINPLSAAKHRIMHNMDQNNPASGLWNGPRIGKRRWQQEPPGRTTQPKTPNTAVQHAALPAGQQGVFKPHDLQLKPGEVISGTPLINVCGSSSASSSAGIASDNSSNAAAEPETSSSSSGSSGSNSCGYRLESELHRGPRSAVWKAVGGASGQPVVIKVLGLGSTEQQTAALRELSALEQASPHAAAAAAADAGAGAAAGSHAAAAREVGAATAPAASVVGVGSLNNHTQQPAQSAATGSNAGGHAGGSSGGSSHLVQLLDAFLVQQQQQCRQQHSGTQSEQQKSLSAQARSNNSNAQAAVEAPSAGSLHLTQQLDTVQQQQQQQQQQVSRAAAILRPAASDSSSSVSAVALVLPHLHQSLSWVLHWMHHRNGRMCLPPAAVRSFAHQLLSALAELHDGHALVHRDVKPSNMLLQQPFVVRSGKKHMMRSMSLQELTSAQWTLVDLGSAGRLLPPTQLKAQQQQQQHVAASQQQQQQQLALPQGQHHHQQEQRWAISSLWGQLSSVLQGGTFNQGSTGSTGSRGSAGNTCGTGRGAVHTPSGSRWQVAAGDVAGYESVSYVPPEAILHCPSTAAYDIWSAACSIYEAATGRRLFPVEEAADERRSIIDRVYRPRQPRGDESSQGGDDVSTSLDEVHLALIKGISGPVPQQVISGTSSSIADALFSDATTGRLWLSEEEEDSGELKQWRHRRCKPLLHKLMERRNMTLQQAVELVEFLQPMLAWDPAERPTAAQLLSHPYFKPLQDESGIDPR